MTDTTHVSHSAQSGDPFSIRPIHPCEAENLMRLRHMAIREYAPYFGTPPTIELGRGAEYYRRQLMNHRRGGKAALLGLWDNDRLCGMAGVRLSRRRPPPFGLIYSMYVATELRGRGCGRNLLQASMRHIRETWRLHRCRMNVEVHNTRALGLYQSCGFGILSTEPRAFRIDGVWYDVYLLESRPVGHS